MKSVELVTISKKLIDVAERSDAARLGWYHDTTAMQGILESDEVRMDATFEDFHMPIRRVVKNDITRYVAVHPEVWEFLHVLEHEVSVKELKEQIANQAQIIRQSKQNLRDMSTLQRAMLRTVRTMSFWQRLKWAFTNHELI